MHAHHHGIILGVTSVVLACAVATTPVRAEPPVDAPSSAHATISLDLRGVDILDALKLFADKSGLNFVAGHNVTGRVTLVAKDVDVWEAFERLLAANELAYERRGALVSVMTAQEYEQLYGEPFQARQTQRVITLQFAKAGPLATVVQQLKSGVGRVVVDEATNAIILRDTPARVRELEALVRAFDRPTATRLYSLHDAEAEKLKERVQEVLTPGVGTVGVDVRTNTMVVTDGEERLARVEQLLRALDTPEPQVLIEAKIVTVELSDQHSLGIDWQQLFGGVDVQARGNFRVLGDILGAGTATGTALKYLMAPKGNTQILVEALNHYGKVQMISNPRIAVSNNKEARILVGKKEAFVTTTTTLPCAAGSVVNAPQVQFVDVGTKLFVTPSVKRDGRIQLKIRPEVSAVSETITDIPNTRIPIIATTEADTNVVVQSGTTVVIGGLIDSRDERAGNQVPFVGNLPLVGAPFRSREAHVTKTELVVFLTPQIMSAGGVPVTSFAVDDAAESLEGGAPAVSDAYRDAVRQWLQPSLAAHLGALEFPEASLTVDFTLGPDGGLIGPPEIASPQGQPVIAATAAALADASPFPPPPSSTRARRIRFRLPVEYRAHDAPH